MKFLIPLCLMHALSNLIDLYKNDRQRFALEISKRYFFHPRTSCIDKTSCQKTYFPFENEKERKLTEEEKQGFINLLMHAPLDDNEEEYIFYLLDTERELEKHPFRREILEDILLKKEAKEIINLAEPLHLTNISDFLAKIQKFIKVKNSNHKKLYKKKQGLKKKSNNSNYNQATKSTVIDCIKILRNNFTTTKNKNPQNSDYSGLKSEAKKLLEKVAKSLNQIDDLKGIAKDFIKECLSPSKIPQAMFLYNKDKNEDIKSSFKEGNIKWFEGPLHKLDGYQTKTQLSNPNKGSKRGFIESLLFRDAKTFFNTIQGKTVLELGSGYGEISKHVALWEASNHTKQKTKFINVNTFLQRSEFRESLKKFNKTNLESLLSDLELGIKNEQEQIRILDDIDEQSISNLWFDLSSIPDNSVDFVFSKKSFPNFSSSIFETMRVLKELARVMKPEAELRMAPVIDRATRKFTVDINPQNSHVFEKLLKKSGFKSIEKQDNYMFNTGDMKSQCIIAKAG